MDRIDLGFNDCLETHFLSGISATTNTVIIGNTILLVQIEIY